MDFKRLAIPEGLETITLVGRNGKVNMVCALARLHSEMFDKWYLTSANLPFRSTSTFNLPDVDVAHITMFVDWCMQYPILSIWYDDVIGLVRFADFLLASRFQAYVMDCVTSTLYSYSMATLAAIAQFAQDCDLALIIMHLRTNIRLISDITERMAMEVLHRFSHSFDVLSVLVGCNIDALSTATKHEIARALIRSTGRRSLYPDQWWADTDKCQWVLEFMASNNEWNVILHHCAKNKTNKPGLFIRQSLRRISLHRKCKSK